MIAVEADEADDLGRRYGTRWALRHCSLVVPAGGVDQLARVGFLAHDAPVYGALSVADHLKLGEQLNPNWDRDLAARRIARLGIPLEQRSGKLSGGQRSQLALTIVMGKRPELLLLDEPCRVSIHSPAASPPRPHGARRRAQTDRGLVLASALRH